MKSVLSRYSGSFENRVTALFRYTKASLADTPYGADELKHIRSKNELLEYYDYTTATVNRRIRATVQYREKAYSELVGVAEPAAIDDWLAYSNTMILRGGYNTVDRGRSLTLAAAIWILDQLNLQDRLDDLYPYLPEPVEDELVCPYVSHPQYDFELISAVVKLILYRNEKQYSGLGMLGSTLMSTKVATPPRKAYDAVIALLDPQAVQAAKERYEEKVWDFYRLTIGAMQSINDKENQLEQEIGNLQKSAVPSVPLMLVKPDNILGLVNQNADKIQSLQRELKQLQNHGWFTEFGLANSREKTVKLVKNIIGEDLAKRITCFGVEDPFEAAFALQQLLDEGSLLPWLFYGSICVAYTLEDQLPFDTKPAPVGKKAVLQETGNLLYTHRFRGYRWDDAQDCHGEPVARTYGKNLSQLLYTNSYGLYPRVLEELPDLEHDLTDMGLENEEQRHSYMLLMHLLGSGNNRADNLQPYLLTHAEEELELPPQPQTLPDWNAEVRDLRRKNYSLRAALHEEDILKRDALRQSRQLREENSHLRRELADLRELVFLQQTEESPVQTEEKSIVFPVTTTGKLVSFGGHPNWIRDMKKLLPNVVFYSADVIPNKDVLRNADQVWVQTQYISHAAFYRIVSALGSDTQLRFFISKSARICAEQLVTG